MDSEENFNEFHTQYNIGESATVGAIQTMVDTQWAYPKMAEMFYLNCTRGNPFALISGAHAATQIIGGILGKHVALVGGDPNVAIQGSVVKMAEGQEETPELVETQRFLRRGMELIIAEACGDHDKVHVILDTIMDKVDLDTPPAPEVINLLRDEAFGTWLALMTIGERLYNNTLLEPAEGVEVTDEAIRAFFETADMEDFHEPNE